MDGVAMLIVDVQKELFEKKIPVYKAGNLLSNICQLTEKAHQAGVPVIYIQHTNSTMPENTVGWQIHPQLRPHDYDLCIRKQHGSAFEKSPLRDILSRLGVNTLVITGLVSHGCIKATCIDSVKWGYRTVLVIDGHSNFHQHPAQTINETHEKLKQLGVILETTSDIHFHGLHL